MAVCLVSFNCDSQKLPVGPLVNSSNPGAYITSGQPLACGETELRLVLHNNYRFPITVTVIGSESGAAKVSYEVIDTVATTPRVVAQVAEEVSTKQEIQPGRHLTFCVPTEYLTASRYVRVPFEIKNETSTTKAAAPEHFAVFYGESLSSSDKHNLH